MVKESKIIQKKIVEPDTEILKGFLTKKFSKRRDPMHWQGVDELRW